MDTNNKLYAPRLKWVSWREFMMCLSFCTFLFYEKWSHLLPLSKDPKLDLFKTLPGPTHYLALILDIIVLSLAFYGLWQLICRRFGTNGSQWFQIALIPLLVFPLSFICTSGELNPIITSLPFSKITTAVFVALIATLTALFILLAVHLPRQTASIFRTCAILLLPFVAITFSQAAYYIWASTAARTLSPAGMDRKKHRVVVLLFDCMDFHLSFEKGLLLEEFERLRRQAIFATQAYPPSEITVLSVPAYLIGKWVAKAEYEPEKGFEVTLHHSTETTRFSALPTIFSNAKALGKRSAVVGWAFPYCKLLGDSLDKCVRLPAYYTGQLGFPRTLHGSMLAFAKRTFSLGTVTEPNSHVYHYREVLKAAKRTLMEDYDLVWIHLPVPHPPPIFDRKTRQLTDSTTQKGTGYIDNLFLSDRTLGELRKIMEDAGTWDETSLLVTSDHWFPQASSLTGKTDHRVPFILKFSNQRSGISLNKPFNTVALHDLVLAMLRQKIRNASTAVSWLGHFGQRSAEIESPYTSPKICNDLPTDCSQSVGTAASLR